jgi:tetratricopeptide (TPR) repeat protein
LHSGAERLAEFGVHYCFDNFREMQSHPPLEGVATEALQRSLKQVGGTLDAADRESYADWFENWNWTLEQGSPDLDMLLALVLSGASSQQEQAVDNLFRSAMERLDGIARASERQNSGHPLSITAFDDFRPMPEQLLRLLLERLPGPLRFSFDALVELPENRSAWTAVEQHFQCDVRSWFRQVDSKLDRILDIQERELSRAVKAKEIAEQEASELRSQAEDYRVKYEKLEAEVSARAQDPAEKRLAELLSAGDLEAVAALKTQQIGLRRVEVEKLAQDWAELGDIHCLRFAWREALNCYREAWRLDPSDPRYPTRYAHVASRQNRLVEAIHAYLAALTAGLEPPEAATVLNNLAILYRATHELAGAERAFDKALAIRRDLAQTEPSSYLSDVAATLNNRANLYGDTERMAEAERDYLEALAIYERLAAAGSRDRFPETAGTLGNLATLYRVMRRPDVAERFFRRALDLYRRLAAANPDEHTPGVAKLLNNLANAYSDAGRVKEAEACYREALTIRRQLAADGQSRSTLVGPGHDTE